MSDNSTTYTLAQMVAVPAKEMDVPHVVALIISKIVKYPDAVSVCITPGSSTTVMDISTDRRDKGPLIGKEGHIQNALRVITRAMMGEEAARKRIIISLTKDEEPDLGQSY
jgi:predicted RNA-binding protein YlqC (UPF0109 family)